jgi:hypothetical protein
MDVKTFKIIKTINNKSYEFEIEAPLKPYQDEVMPFFLTVRCSALREKMFASFFYKIKTLEFNIPVFIENKKVERISIDESVADELKKIQEQFYEEAERIKKKKKEEEKEKEEKEFELFMNNDNYFKNDVIISQEWDGDFYPVEIENKKIREFVTKAINKYLAGVIFDGWRPGYYVPPSTAIFFVEDLIKEKKAEKIRNNEGLFLKLSGEIANKIVSMYKQELKRKEEELKQKIRNEKKVLIKSWSEACCNPFEECDVDVHYIYAFASEEEAKKFAEEQKTSKGKVEFDETLNAYTVHIWRHRW